MYMNTCKFCGKQYFSRVKEFACEACKPLDDALFSKIETYLVNYPNSNAMQIAEGLEISTLDVLRYIDEGRLQISKGVFHKL